MPRPPETPEVKTSKSLSYILRHGAEKEGLYIRSDGFIKLSDVLARPKLKGVAEEYVFQLVRDNTKQRFELFYGYDPSPPRPKKKPVQGKSKKQKQAEREAAVAGSVDGALFAPASEGVNKGSDSAEIDTLQTTLVATTLLDSKSPKSAEPPELPLVSVPVSSLNDQQSEPRGMWFIRATQGHSIQLDSTTHLTELHDDIESREKAGLIVHGTRWELWHLIKTDGLKRMTRQHIHLAPSLSGRITPRPSSTLYIYLSLPKLLNAKIPVYVSSNGVILTPGLEEGLGKLYWRKVVRQEGGKRIVVWDGIEEVQREETDEEKKEDNVLKRDVR
ncbi:hypothetical protein L204_101282 [Cryptococcus depauperatus]|nr:hypothetical protein L204_03953 [Cryptococcus depauperatus CBS 7855]